MGISSQGTSIPKHHFACRFQSHLKGKAIQTQESLSGNRATPRFSFLTYYLSEPARDRTEDPKIKSLLLYRLSYGLLLNYLPYFIRIKVSWQKMLFSLFFNREKHFLFVSTLNNFREFLILPAIIKLHSGGQFTDNFFVFHDWYINFNFF